MPRCWVGDRECEEASFSLVLSQSWPLSCRGKVASSQTIGSAEITQPANAFEFPLGTEAPFSLQGEPEFAHGGPGYDRSMKQFSVAATQLCWFCHLQPWLHARLRVLAPPPHPYGPSSMYHTPLPSPSRRFEQLASLRRCAGGVEGSLARVLFFLLLACTALRPCLLWPDNRVTRPEERDKR